MAHPQSIDLFDAYFRRADLDHDGRISGNEALVFFQGANLPKQVLAQVPLLSLNSFLDSIFLQKLYPLFKIFPKILIRRTWPEIRLFLFCIFTNLASKALAAQ